MVSISHSDQFMLAQNDGITNIDILTIKIKPNIRMIVCGGKCTYCRESDGEISVLPCYLLRLSQKYGSFSADHRSKYLK